MRAASVSGESTGRQVDDDALEIVVVVVLGGLVVGGPRREVGFGRGVEAQHERRIDAWPCAVSTTFTARGSLLADFVAHAGAPGARP